MLLINNIYVYFCLLSLITAKIILENKLITTILKVLYLDQYQQLLTKMQNQNKRSLAQMLRDQSTPLKLKSHPNLHIKILNKTHAQQIIDLLTHCFSQYQPLTIAYCKLIPEGKENDSPHWRFFWDSFSEDYLTNGCSVGLFDSQNGDNLIGVSAAVDLHDGPQNFQSDVAKRSRMLEGVLQLEKDLLKKIKGEYSKVITEKGAVLDIWIVALHQDYMGKRLLHQMIIANEVLGLQLGYKYTFCFCTNWKTTKALEKIDYVLVSDVNAKQFVLHGQRYFQYLDPEHPYISLWMKPITVYPPETII